MKWFEPIIIAVAVCLVVIPIINYIKKKLNGTLKCECGHLQSECTLNCSTCSLATSKNDNSNYVTYILTIEGMKCGMCESHINDVIRNNFDIIQVKSSRKKGISTITTNRLLDLSKLRSIIVNEGYTVSSIRLK